MTMTNIKESTDDAFRIKSKGLWNIASSEFPDLGLVSNTDEHDGRKKQKFHIFPFYLNMAYYFLHLPYKPVQDPETSTWKLGGTRVQKVLSALMWLITAYVHLTVLNNLEDFGVKWKSTSPKKYFQIVCLILIYFRLAGFVRTFWDTEGKTKIEDLLNQIDKGGPLFSRKPDKFWKRLGILYIILVHVYCIVRTVEYMWDPKTGCTFALTGAGLRRTINGGRKRFFVEAYNMTDTFKPTTGDVALATLEFFLRFISAFQFALTLLMFLVPIPITLWQATSNFEKLVESAPALREMSHGKAADIQALILSQWEALKEFSDNLNRNWATLELLWILETSMQPIFAFKRMMESGSPLHIVMLLSGMTCFIIAMMISAEVARMITSFKTWLLSPENQEIFDRFEWDILMMEVEGGPIGVGSDGLFQVTYGFLAQLLNVVITLFVVSFDQD